MYEEDEVECPIFLITGFLESGKTSFINFTVAQDYFQIDGPTLLITTEEGEVEYDEKELLKHNTVLEIVEGPEQFTLDYLKKLNRKYRPERIILEYNPLWSVKKLEEMELPRGWGIVQEIVTVDASCFQIYMQNMKSVFMEMAKNVDMGDNPERYEGKTVHFRGMVLKSKDVGADFFVPGRMAMTCCADDTSFIGYVCKCASAKSLVMGSWVDVTATVKWGYMKVYDGEGPVLYAKEIKPAKKPESELVYFN